MCELLRRAWSSSEWPLCAAIPWADEDMDEAAELLWADNFYICGDNLAEIRVRIRCSESAASSMGCSFGGSDSLQSLTSFEAPTPCWPRMLDGRAFAKVS